MRVVGWELRNGDLLCIDCTYPPEPHEIKETVTPGTEDVEYYQCDMCLRTLNQVEPVDMGGSAE